MTQRTKNIAIIGGGIGGMAAANLLAVYGYSVDVYESRPSLGGRMDMLEAEGFRFDTGPSWYLMPEVYDHYYRLLGTTADAQLRLRQLSPAYQVFIQNETKPLTIYGNEVIDTANFDKRSPGAGAALGNYLDSAERVYNLALKYFLYTNFDSPTELMRPEIIRHLPAMLSASGSMHRYVAKRFSEPGLQHVLEYPAVFLGSSPFTVPAMYHLMSYLDFRQGVYYPMGGMYQVTATMANLGKTLGVRYHTNSPVRRIKINNGKATGITLADGRSAEADIVISNADLHHTQCRLLPPAYRDYPEKYWQKREAGPSALLMYLGVRGTLPQLTHHNLLFVQDWRRNFDDIFVRKSWGEEVSMYVCKPSATDATVAPQGSENVFVLVPAAARPGVGKAELRRLATRYLQQIAQQTGINDLLDRITYQKFYGPDDFAADLNSWNGTALGLSHRLRQSAMFRPSVRSRKVANLYYVGANTRPGIGVPMCLISAELVVKQIIGWRHAGRLPEPAD